MNRVSTPGLVVSPRTRIRRMRRMPVEGELLTGLGDKVKSTDIVARANLPGSIHQIAAASVLGVPRSTLKGSMLAKEGDRLDKDQVIARSSFFFGLFKAEVRAPFPCVLESVSTITGHVLLRAMPQPLELLAYVSGEIVDVLPRQGVDVLSDASVVQGIFGLGGEKHGELFRVCKSREQVLDADLITPDARGKVLLGGAEITLRGFERMREIGVAGAVTGSVDGSDINTLLGETVNLAATGDEKLGFSLVVTEGFGQLPMAQRSFEILDKLCGQVVSVRGVTQVRAGAVRPEVIGAPVDVETPNNNKEGLGVGDKVRIVRGDFFGQVGLIAELPTKPHLVGSGAMTLVVRVKMDDENVVTVPRANVEY